MKRLQAYCLLGALLTSFGASRAFLIIPRSRLSSSTFARRCNIAIRMSTKDEVDTTSKSSTPLPSTPLGGMPPAPPASVGRRRPDPEKGASYFDFEDETAPSVPQQLEGDLLRDGGVMKTIVTAGEGPLVTPGAEVAVKYEGRTADKQVLCRGEDFRFLQGDGTMIGGFETAVGSMRVGEVARVQIQPWYAYGSAGVSPVVSPDMPLDFDIEVLEASGNFLNPKSFRDVDPKKLRDAKSIARDYAQRSELRMRNEEGLSNAEKASRWFKSLYFFGFFEGETGERPPWYLTPTITFPIMFVTCAAAFYVLISFGGVSIKRDLVLEDSVDLGAAFLDQIFA